MKEFVSFCMTVYNDRKNIQKCLNSILNLNYPKEKMEIIIHDSNSNDGTEEVIKEYQKKYPSLIKVIKVKANRSKGRNLALKRAKSREFIAIVNSDVELDKSWLFNALKIIKSNKRIGVVASNQIKPDNFFEKLIWWIPGMAEISFASTPELYKNKLIKVINAPCEAALYRRNVLFKAGLFNEKINWGEDPELSHRIRNLGFLIVANKDVKIRHYYKVELKKFIKQQFMYGYGGVKLKQLSPITFNEQIPLFKRIGIYFFPPFVILFILSLIFFLDFVLPLLSIGIIAMLVIYGRQCIRASINERNPIFFLFLFGLLLLKTICNATGFIYASLRGK